MGAARWRIPGRRRGQIVLALGVAVVVAIWGVPSHLQGQAPDELAQASFLRWGCAGCHGAPWAGIPAVGAPSVEALGEALGEDRTRGWLVGYLMGDSLLVGARHPIPFGGPPPVADTLAGWLLGEASAPPSGGDDPAAPEVVPPTADLPPAEPPPAPAGTPSPEATPFEASGTEAPQAGPADPLEWTGALPQTEAWRTPAAAVAAVALLGVLLLLVRPAPVLGAGGWALAALLLAVLPVLAFGLGAGHHLDRSRTTEFCLSCHIMEPWGESLTGAAGSQGALAAMHFQDRLIPRDRACYTCHTQYTMYGDLQAKALGVRHLLVNLTGAPDTLRLYSPYENRECLHCHTGAEGFETLPMHQGLEPGGDREDRSCLTCHGPAHGLEGVG